MLQQVKFAHKQSQSYRKKEKGIKPLAVWLTLPVSTDGLTSDGVNAVKILLDEDVELAGVNGMTMNFGRHASLIFRWVKMPFRP